MMKKVANKSPKTRREEDLPAKIKRLESKLAEAEETLRAIRLGEVDALAVETAAGPQIFTLKGAEQPYRVMVDAMNEGAVTMTPDGMIIYCNKRFADMVNIAMKHIVGTSIRRFIREADQPLFDQFTRKPSKRKRERIEVYLSVAGGTSIPVLISQSELNDDASGAMCLLLTDIAELRKAQQDLQESHNLLEQRIEERTSELRWSEEKYRDLIEASNSIIMKADGDLNITYMNEFGLNFFGYTEKELIGKNVIGTTIPEMDDDGHDLAAMIRDLTRHPDIYQTNVHKNMRKNGELVWVSWTNNIKYDAQGNFLEILAVGNDISRLKRAEEETFNTKLRLEALLNALPVGVSFSDDPTCQYITGNPAVLAQFGMQPEDNMSASSPDFTAKGRQVHYFHNGCEVSDVELPLQRAVAENREIPSVELEVVLPDGRHWFANASAAPVRDANGKVVGGVAVTLDITERKQMETALENWTGKLEEANRELESFSYSVSHDLRAPLRAIDGYSRMVLRRNEAEFDDETRQKFNLIRENAKLMAKLIDDLLSFSQVQKKNMNISAVDMDNLARSVWNEIRETNKDRKIEFRIEGVPPAQGDPNLIRQVLVNLFSNAVKFTKNKECGIIEVNSHTESGKVVYCIRDNGCGFDMAHYDKLFGVFQRLHGNDEYEGTGIGLAIVQRVIQRHEGHVWARGEVGKGAAFYFSLPFAPADEAVSERASDDI